MFSKNTDRVWKCFSNKTDTMLKCFISTICVPLLFSSYSDKTFFLCQIEAFKLSDRMSDKSFEYFVQSGGRLSLKFFIMSTGNGMYNGDGTLADDVLLSCYI